MKNISVYFCILLLLVSCGRKENNQSDIPVIDIAAAMSGLSEVKLSDIAEEIEYIPLETTENSLIGTSPSIKVLKDYILVSSRPQPLMLFDRHNGRFIRTIGSIGNGPGEYGGGTAFQVDEQKGCIYINGNSGFLVYDLSGAYLGDIKLNLGSSLLMSLSSSSFFFFNGDEIFAHHKGPDKQVSISRFDSASGQKTDSIPLFGESLSFSMEEIRGISILNNMHVSFGAGGLMHFVYSEGDYLLVPESPSLWKSDGKIRFKENFIDTVYTIENNHLLPYIAFNLGRWHWPYEQRTQKEIGSTKIHIDYVLEGQTNLYFHYHTNLYDLAEKQAYCGVFDKESATVKVMKGDEIADDINNFIAVSVRGLSSTGEYMGLIEAPDIYEWFNESRGEITDQKLKALQSLTEEDNPVVVLMKK